MKFSFFFLLNVLYKEGKFNYLKLHSNKTCSFKVLYCRYGVEVND